ncbi:transporter [Streptomyces sp. LX-29]|uniref:transporter n=1 Tax=Streptomyces sp. LX-29 TaxID=2900152 RepID=UPI00240D034C|nr:transporter [Streptomyces sp. LX-29]WFB08895.1 transporter [Streptomyces sp. LX-29]
MSALAPTPAPGAAGRARPVTARTTIPVFARLKLSLLVNGLRMSSGRRAAYISSLVFTALFAALQLLGLILLRGVDHAEALVVCLTALMALGWAVMPLFFSSGDETLDPTRLVMLPLRPRPLVVALLLSSLIGIGPLFTLTLAAGSVVSVAHGGAAVAVGVVAVPLVLLVCVALARAVATANVRLLTSRKGRDLALLSGLFIAIGAQFVNLGWQKLSGEGGLESLTPAAEVLRWVPPASAIDAVWRAGEGAYGAALGQLALSAAALVLLLWWWARSLTRLMSSPDSATLQAAEPGRRGTGEASGGLAGLLPADRTGVAALRTLRYAWRDPKSKAGWVSGLAVGILVPVVTVLQGTGSIYAACWATGLMGLQMYNQFGQDHSAFWMVTQTISTPRDAYLELRGRALALGLVALPYATLVVLGSAALTQDWAAFPEALGLTLALTGALIATGAFSSVYYAYTIPQDSGFKNVAPGQNGIAALSVLGGMVAGVLICAPLIALTVWLHQAGADDWLWTVLPLGVAYGYGVAEAGLRLAAPRAAARLPEILTAVTKG